MVVFNFLKIRVGSPLKKRRISLGRGDLVWALESPYYLGRKIK
jgi:hypothetical protein